jgi:hypothetical protein
MLSEAASASARLAAFLVRGGAGRLALCLRRSPGILQPDAHKYNPRATRLAELNAAYEVLGDENIWLYGPAAIVIQKWLGSLRLWQLKRQSRSYGSDHRRRGNPQES